MRITRNCPQGLLNTGMSGCPIDFAFVVAAILVAKGQKLPADLDAEDLAELCHADRPSRVMPIKGLVEYAKNGGEAQTSAVGYGPSQYTGMSQQTDTFSLSKFIPELHANIMKGVNVEFGVYYVDKDNNIIGVNDGTDTLAPIAVTLVPNATPFRTSSAQSVQTVGFSYVDTEHVQKHYDYFNAGFDVVAALVGLVEVEIVPTGTATKYKLLEHIGGYDRTAEFGTIIGANVTDLIDGASAGSYADGVLTLTVASGDVPTLKAPSALYAKGIEGIVQYEP